MWDAILIVGFGTQIHSYFEYVVSHKIACCHCAVAVNKEPMEKKNKPMSFKSASGMCYVRIWDDSAVCVFVCVNWCVYTYMYAYR